MEWRRDGKRPDYFQTFIRTELSAYIRNVQGLSSFFEENNEIRS